MSQEKTVRFLNLLSFDGLCIQRMCLLHAVA